MDFAQYFVDTAALSAAVVAIVAFVKKHVLKNLHDLATVGVSLLVGAALGVGGHFLGYLTAGLPAAASFGLAAGFLASGGWDAVGGLLAKRRAPGE